MTAYPSGLSHIAAFRQHFIQRYGYHRQVPVLELLDPNFGLGAQWKAALAELDEPVVEGEMFNVTAQEFFLISHIAL